MARTASRAMVRATPGYRAPRPIVVRSYSRPHKKKHHRRSVGAGSKVNQKTMMGAALGGAIMGFIDKTFTTLPTVPLLGRAGTIAVAAYFLSGRGGIGAIARDVALAGAAVAGYELGKEGKVSGGEIMGGGQVAPQVHGGGRGVFGGGLANQV